MCTHTIHPPSLGVGKKMTAIELFVSALLGFTIIGEQVDLEV
jgi:hypothetical protein